MESWIQIIAVSIAAALVWNAFERKFNSILTEIRALNVKNHERHEEMKKNLWIAVERLTQAQHRSPPL